MIDTNINRLTVKGNNNIIFHSIDSSGESIAVEKSLQEILQPFVKQHQEQIIILKNSIEDKEKIQGYLDKEVLVLSRKVWELEQERKLLEDQVIHLLKELDGKDLSNTTDLYKEAFNYFINGKVDSALSVLDEAKMQEEEKIATESIKQVAETRMLKARILRVKNKFEGVGLQYERALRLYSNWNMCLEVANYFQFLNKFDKAYNYYQTCLKKAKSDFEMATTLNNLANLQSDKNALEQAELMYNEALEIYRTLAKANPEVYLPYVATTLNNLAVLQRAKNALEQAERLYNEALEIYRTLAEANPEVYLPDVAMTLNNLANLQSDKNALEQAELMYNEALEIYRTLAEANPEVYLPDVAMTLNNLANLQRAKNALEQAELLYNEALEIRRRLAEANPEVYLPDVAMTLNNLAVLQSDKNALEQAELLYNEALEIRRRLAEANPEVYLPDVAMTLNNLANLQSDKNALEQAELLYNEALEIRRRLAEANPEVYEIQLANTYLALSIFYSKNKVNKELSKLHAEKSLVLYQKFWDFVPHAKTGGDQAKEIIEFW